MRIRRYVASTMQQAVAMVRGDLGDEAVILNTKRFKRGGMFGLFGKPKVEIVAAVEPGKGLRRDRGPRREEQLRQAQSATVEALSLLQEEVRSLRDLVGGHVLAEPNAPAGVRAVLDHLVSQEIPGEAAQQIVAGVTDATDGAEPLEADALWDAVTERLAADIAVAPLWDFDKKPTVVPFVGPTGVGKTTTIAKLAANLKLLAQKDIGLVTADTYRVAAVEQLRTYANIIGIDLHVAYTPDELQQAVSNLADRDLILIDTAGRSQNNAMHMGELRAFLDMLEDPQVHLVMSATTRQTDLEDIAARFAPCGYERLIFTKVDETSTYGTLYELPRRTGKPLAYITVGQSVPDAIEVANADRIAGLIMGNGQ